ncbi:MAG: GAF domain-containing protein [Boseongicola sp.]|nr:MAG: GAF domain-containing protein [Boseongicola sp.]
MSTPNNPDLSFNLSDLGLLDGRADREIAIIVRNAALILRVPTVTFFVEDRNAARLFLRAYSGWNQAYRIPDELPLRGSLTAEVVESGESTMLIDLVRGGEFATTPEVCLLSAGSFLAVPVAGPAGETIGVMAAFTREPQRWSHTDKAELMDQAHLLSRHILLKASLQTLKFVSRERVLHRSANRIPI